MKTYLDCYACLMRQALSASRKAGAPEALQKEVLINVMEELQHLPSETTPAEMAYKIHRVVRDKTAIEDPYKKAKKQATQEALSLYSELKKKIDAAADRLEMAVRIAIAGNIIDLGVSESYDMHATLSRVLTQPFAINDLPSLRKALSESSSVLFLADNVGETVFDRVLIEELNMPVTYVVKAGPIINDATREDAEASGIAEIAEIIDNGSQAPGTILEQCSQSFIQRFEQADLILAKGQANYESLSENPAPIFFLLQAKCNVIARDLRVHQTDIVLKYRD